MSSKKRKYDGKYLQYGFSFVTINGDDRPQCVICSKVLANDSMKPTKLKQHLDNVHPQHKDKDKSYFERQENMFKKMKLGASGSFQDTGHKITEASYVVALEIVKQKKPDTIGETLIKPCALKMVEIVLGNGLEKS